MDRLQELDGNLDTIRNFACIAKLLIKHGIATEFNIELLPSLLEAIYEHAQKLVEEYCVKVAP